MSIVMKTIIELFDREPIENVLGMLMMNPQQVVFLGDKKIMREYRKESILRFAKQRGLQTKISFYHYDCTNYQNIIDTYQRVVQANPSCAFEVTGGKEIPLLAAGAFCIEQKIPVNYFDYRSKKFFNVFQNSTLPEISLPKLSVRDILTLAGGSMMRHGHFNQEYRSPEMQRDILSVWDIYKKHRQEWGAQTTFFQQIQTEDEHTLAVSVPEKLSGKVNAECNFSIMQALAERGIILRLHRRNGQVSFQFKNEHLRKCLSDAGIWLELYTGLCADQTKFFDDVQVSVVIDWDGSDHDPNDTTNEIDVMLVHELTPIFISCKTGVPSTHALNEIKLLAERFGGITAKAVLVTSTAVSKVAPATYRRAGDMGVMILEEEELFNKQFPQKLTDIAEGRFWMRRT